MRVWNRVSVRVSVVLAFAASTVSEAAGGSPAASPPSRQAAPARSVFRLERFDAWANGGFRISYPPGWEVKTWTRPGFNVMFIDNAPGKAQRFRRNVVVISAEQPRLSLDAWLDRADEIARNSGMPLWVQKIKWTTFAGQRAVLRTVVNEVDGVPLRQRQLALYSGGRVFTVTLSAASTEFESSLPVFDSIAGSMEIRAAPAR
jgi:hypothetical protein